MSRERQPVVLDLRQEADHPVMCAWRAFAGTDPEVVGLEALKRTKKTKAFRLTLRNWSHPTVVAKWRPDSQHFERWVFTEVLPDIGVPTVAVYGEHPANDRGGWTFLEDVGPPSFSLHDPEHRRLVAEWLVAVHSWARLDRHMETLPDRGPDHYLTHLRSARETIALHMGHPWIDADSRSALSALIEVLIEIQERWPIVLALCADAPRMLVHGDLAEKNVRVLEADGRRTLRVLDWEMAGIGVASVDLSEVPDVEHVARGLCSAGIHVSVTRVREWAGLGRLFRRVSALDWESYKLGYEWCHLPTFRMFGTFLRDSAAALGVLRAGPGKTGVFV